MTPEEAVIALEKTGDLTKLLSVLSEKQLRLLLHPDRFGRRKSWAERATLALFKLDTLLKKPSIKQTVISKWVVLGPLAQGDIADLHRVESTDGVGVLKITKLPRDNDFITNERSILTKLHKPNDPASRILCQYLPGLLDGFTASYRGANVLTMADGYVALSDITKLMKLDFRHVVWMMNRALSVLGYCHAQGVVHGAVVPEHLMYDPANHNICLVDWCYASVGKPLVAIASGHRKDYPPEVLRSQSPTSATDLYMLATALRHVALVPKRFRSLFDLCMVQSLASRTSDAWAFQDRWKAAAEQEYGPPKFVPLVLPVQ